MSWEIKQGDCLAVLKTMADGGKPRLSKSGQHLLEKELAA